MKEEQAILVFTGVQDRDRVAFRERVQSIRILAIVSRVIIVLKMYQVPQANRDFTEYCDCYQKKGDSNQDTSTGCSPIAKNP